MCDNNYNITFYANSCEIRRNGSEEVSGTGTRTPGNVYIWEEIQGEKCYVGQIVDNWLWHKKIGHFNFDNLVKISRT